MGHALRFIGRRGFLQVTGSSVSTPLGLCGKSRHQSTGKLAHPPRPGSSGYNVVGADSSRNGRVSSERSALATDASAASPLHTLSMAALWVGFKAYGFLAPRPLATADAIEAEQTAFLRLLLPPSSARTREQEQAAIQQLAWAMNAMRIWPAIYLQTNAPPPANRRGSLNFALKAPGWPFVSSSFAFGVLALLPCCIACTAAGEEGQAVLLPGLAGRRQQRQRRSSSGSTEGAGMRRSSSVDALMSLGRAGARAAAAAASATVTTVFRARGSSNSSSLFSSKLTASSSSGSLALHAAHEGRASTGGAQRRASSSSCSGSGVGPAGLPPVLVAGALSMVHQALTAGGNLWATYRALLEESRLCHATTAAFVRLTAASPCLARAAPGTWDHSSAWLPVLSLLPAITPTVTTTLLRSKAVGGRPSTGKASSNGAPAAAAGGGAGAGGGSPGLNRTGSERKAKGFWVSAAKAAPYETCQLVPAC